MLVLRDLFRRAGFREQVAHFTNAHLRTTRDTTLLASFCTVSAMPRSRNTIANLSARNAIGERGLLK